MIEFASEAVEEVDAAFRWYSSESQALGDSFVTQLRRVLAQVESNPKRYPSATDNARWALMSRFPYLVVFRVGVDSSVRVVAVAHAHRRAGYWRSRT